VQLREGYTLANFVAGADASPQRALERLLRGDHERCLHLIGPPASGKTHLLQAACHEMARRRRPAAYVPLARCNEFDPALLADLDTMQLVCLDDVHVVAGQPRWERALFNLYNDLEAGGARLLLSSPAIAACYQLPDLASRLAAVLRVRLPAPDDDLRTRILAARARGLGFELPDDAIRYLLAHCPRDLHSLMQALDGIDGHALATQRRVSLALVLDYLRARDG
jgi:DnaA family protein